MQINTITQGDALAEARLDGSIKRHIAQKNAQSLDDLPLFKDLDE